MKKKGNSIQRMLVARKYKEDQKQNQIESNRITNHRAIFSMWINRNKRPQIIKLSILNLNRKLRTLSTLKIQIKIKSARFHAMVKQLQYCYL